MRRHAVLDTKDLSPTVYVLRLERAGLDFRPGQYIRLGPDSLHMREYSVYSPPSVDYLEALIKVVEKGSVSGRLRRLRPGDAVCVDGPYGELRIHEPEGPGPHLFVATGTGIAPFHCFVSTYPGLEHHVAHGVPNTAELYHRERYSPKRHTACLSRERTSTAFPGRVTDWLRLQPLSAAHCYLCGGYPMIAEAHAILSSRGVPAHRIHAEVYF